MIARSICEPHSDPRIIENQLNKIGLDAGQRRASTAGSERSVSIGADKTRASKCLNYAVMCMTVQKRGQLIIASAPDLSQVSPGAVLNMRPQGPLGRLPLHVDYVTGA